MKRRDFLRNSIPAAAIFPAIVDGYSVKAFNSDSPLLRALMDPEIDTDHVLVIIQLSGGNDGLNMVIPISNYSGYYNARTNIAIPEAKILKLNGYAQTGLHPIMTGMQTLYNNEKLNIVQAVGYPDPNFSHFRATDIWMSGSDADKNVTTGWTGRYLATEYPNYPVGYPNDTMKDPLAIQIGSVSSLALQGPSINMGMSITDPTSFYNLINGIEDPVPNTPAGHELAYIRKIAELTNQYAKRIKEAAGLVTQQTAYPDNSLADQLKIVARLIGGGLKTRIYMVSHGGFDTHSQQTEAADTTTGNHATLLGELSTAVKAFMDDCKYLAIDERVIGMTFSEFGRRIKSNGSMGTDHGAAAPMLLFGKNVKQGVTGNNPTMPSGASVNDNVPFQYDFRSVYASILEKWFCVSSANLEAILFKNFQSLDVINDESCTGKTNEHNQDAGDNLISTYPNPFTDSDPVTIKFTSRGGHTLVQIIDALGRVVRTPVDGNYEVGNYSVTFNSTGLPSGAYYARWQNGTMQQVKPMLKVRG
ncbi:MAG: DUF1501 domain-containing protein [Chitinophagaceae bacterium]